jgi:hypothetical protein
MSATVRHHGILLGRTLALGAAVIVDGVPHLPSDPAGLPATGTSWPFQAMSATVIHQGILVGRSVALGIVGAEAVFGGETVDELAGEMNVDAWNEDDDGLTMIVEVMVMVTVSLLSSAGGDGAAGGGTVDVRVTVTCIVLWSLAAGGGAGTELSKAGWLDGSEGAGGLLVLGSVTRVVEFDGIIGGATERVDGLLVDAPGAPDGDIPGQLRSTRGWCVVGSIMPQSGWLASESLMSSNQNVVYFPTIVQPTSVQNCCKFCSLASALPCAAPWKGQPTSAIQIGVFPARCFTSSKVPEKLSFAFATGSLFQYGYTVMP